MNWSNRNKKTFSNGQALAELAIFASIFLFVLSLLIQYGLSFSHTQEERMVTFRKALYLAQQGGPNGLSGHYVRVDDREVPNITDEANFSESFPFGSGASVTMSHGLAGDRTFNDPEHLQRSYVEINGQNIQGRYGSYLTTGAWAERDLGSGTPVKVHVAKNPFGNGPSWEWQDKYLTWVMKCTDPYGNCNSGVYCNSFSEVTSPSYIIGTLADVDDDQFEEQITDYGYKVAQGSCFNPGEVREGVTCPNVQGVRFCYKRYASHIRYIDLDKGDINWTDENQGYRPDYEKTVSVDASLERSENTPSSEAAIVTQDKVVGEETIKHKFITQVEPQQPDIVSTKSIDKTFKWETPNE